MTTETATPIGNTEELQQKPKKEPLETLYNTLLEAHEALKADLEQGHNQRKALRERNERLKQAMKKVERESLNIRNEHSKLKKAVEDGPTALLVAQTALTQKHIARADELWAKLKEAQVEGGQAKRRQAHIEKQDAELEHLRKTVANLNQEIRSLKASNASIEKQNEKLRGTILSLKGKETKDDR